MAFEMTDWKPVDLEMEMFVESLLDDDFDYENESNSDNDDEEFW
jgi:hypothetical protein